jgi:hypothetical protein
MQPTRRRKTFGLLLVVLFTAAAARAMPVVADEDPISSPITVSSTATSTNGAWAIHTSDAVSSATDPGSDTVSDPADTVSDTVSDPIDTVSDTVSDPTDTVSDTVSDPTDTVSDTVSDATGAVSSAASGATGRGSDYGLGGATTRGNTPTREGQVPCDAQTNTCFPDPTGSGLARAVERILGVLAQTGWAVLPWIVIAVGLAALGIFLLRSSRRRTSRT